MAITDKEEGVWGLDQVYNKINQGGIWDYDGIPASFCMGKNTYGDLGLNDRAGRSSPTQLPGTTWSKISSNAGRGFRGLKTDGTAWAWGYNNMGQLGINLGSWHPSVIVDRSSPCQIGTDTTWSDKFSSDDSTSFWIKTDGTLWSWGYNAYGMLGQNTPGPTRRSSPTQVGTNTTWDECLVGSGTALARKTDGSLWAWGRNYTGSVGQNTAAPIGAFTSGFSSPCRIGTGTDWAKLGMAADTCFAQKTDGTLWAWGGDAYGKQARNAGPVNRSSPMQVNGTGWDLDPDKFSYASSHCLAIKTDGTLWSWGYNPFGNLGLNDRGAGGATSRSSPTQVGTSTDWSQVAGGYLTSIATKTDGTLWTWGENEGGQMGHNTSGSPTAGAISSPTQIPGTGWSDPAASREEFFVKGLL